MTDSRGRSRASRAGVRNRSLTSRYSARPPFAPSPASCESSLAQGVFVVELRVVVSWRAVPTLPSGRTGFLWSSCASSLAHGFFERRFCASSLAHGFFERRFCASSLALGVICWRVARLRRRTGSFAGRVARLRWRTGFFALAVREDATLLPFVALPRRREAVLILDSW